MNLEELSQKDLTNKIWFMPTDTIPGISALHDDAEAAEKVRAIKYRDPNKKFIVLISSFDHLAELDIELPDQHMDFLHSVWPGPVTVAFSASMAVRMPNKKELQEFINTVGPIISTSCNHAGEEPIVTSKEAQESFGELINYYIDCDGSGSKPSTIVSIIR